LPDAAEAMLAAAQAWVAARAQQPDETAKDETTPKGDEDAAVAEPEHPPATA